ncbi:MAG: lamin tail domain-containing protein [Anaerolineales bacterium]|nr:lamin tail domain-containing protein [Anaerolineales bacterium]
MQNFRRIVYFLLLNVLVSAVTVWVVVTIIFRNQAVQPAATLPALASLPEEQTGEILVTEPSTFQDSSDNDVLDVIPDLLEIESILGSGELETERVLIKHIGETEVSLVGWQLQDEDGNAYSFPALTMFQGGAVTLYTRRGTSTVVELYWGQDQPVWQSGERAYLLDPDAEIQAVYTVP